MAIIDLKSCIEHIKKAHPRPKSLRVETHALEQIRADIEALRVVKKSPRPTYGPPFGDIDRFLWDELERQMKLAPIQVMGVSIIT